MRQVILNTGVVVQQDQQAPFPFVLPQRSVEVSHLTPVARLSLQTADAVVGSATDVANGVATNTSIQSAVNYVNTFGGGKILVLDSTYVENVTVPSNVFMEGMGYAVYVQGSITFTGDCSLVRCLRHQDVVFNAGTDRNGLTDTWVEVGYSITNSGLPGNYWTGVPGAATPGPTGPTGSDGTDGNLIAVIFNNQTGTTYLTQDSDQGKVVNITNSSSITTTLHNTAPVGFSCSVVQGGTGVITFVAESGGALLNRAAHTKTAGRYAAVSFVVLSNAGSAAQWLMSGDTVV